MDAVDTWIPTPDRKEDMPFLMPVEDVFTISGRGTVATGRVERGILKLNEKVEIVGLQDEKRETVVTGIEMFHKPVSYTHLDVYKRQTGRRPWTPGAAAIGAQAVPSSITSYPPPPAPPRPWAGSFPL